MSPRLLRWLRPPRILRPTRAGWCFFAITLGVGFAALNTGNNLLYLVLSLLLAFLVLSGVLSESALRGIRVRRRLPREIFAGCENPVWLEIENTQRRVPSFAVVIEDRLAPRGDDREPRAAGRVFVLRVAAGSREARHYHLRPEERGPLLFSEFRVSTRFPFGLFLKFLTIEAPARGLAYPAVEALRSPPLWRGPHESGDALATRSGEGSDVSGLREFRDGDGLRRVHWKASLRRNALVVREIEEERSSVVEVSLRTHRAGGGGRSGFEQRVRWAASEVVAHLGAGLRVALRTDSESLPAEAGPGQRRRLLSFLACVQRDGEQSAASAR